MVGDCVLVHTQHFGYFIVVIPILCVALNAHTEPSTYSFPREISLIRNSIRHAHTHTRSRHTAADIRIRAWIHRTHLQHHYFRSHTKSTEKEKKNQQQIYTSNDGIQMRTHANNHEAQEKKILIQLCVCVSRAMRWNQMYIHIMYKSHAITATPMSTYFCVSLCESVSLHLVHCCFCCHNFFRHLFYVRNRCTRA